MVGTLAAALIFANSITVFAYEDTFHEYMPEVASEDVIEDTLQNDTWQFVPEETGEEETADFDMTEVGEIRYDEQFTDEEGNIYPIFEETPAETYRGCNHNFVSGTITTHRKTSDGGCVVEQYHGQRCSKCGTAIRGDLINVVTFQVCPH